MIEEHLLSEFNSNPNYESNQSQNGANKNEILFADNQNTNDEDLITIGNEEDKEIEIIEIIDNDSKITEIYENKSTIKLLLEITEGVIDFSLLNISYRIGNPIIKISQMANTKCIQWFGL